MLAYSIRIATHTRTWIIDYSNDTELKYFSPLDEARFDF